jgi:hypothetical protein
MTVLNHVPHPPRAPPQRKRRRIAEPQGSQADPAQLLVDEYNARLSATAQFPLKITSRHIRAAMRRYEKVIENARAEVEVSCASCGEFPARTTLHRNLSERPMSATSPGHY